MSHVIQARELTKRFGSVTALDRVSFAFDGPGVIGILGPNGAGKSTLLDLLEGLSRPDSGEVLLFGEPIARYPRHRVGVVLQREAALDTLTVGEYAELFAAIHRVRDGAARILATSRLEDRGRTPMARISGGELARLVVATALVHDPELVFLDEPTAALDPANKRAMGELFRAIGRERTVVLTTHDLREAEAVCDQLIFLVDGSVRAAGPKHELVASVPEDARGGSELEAAFFHYCAVRMRDGEIEAEREA